MTTLIDSDYISKHLQINPMNNTLSLFIHPTTNNKYIVTPTKPHTILAQMTAETSMPYDTTFGSVFYPRCILNGIHYSVRTFRGYVLEDCQLYKEVYGSMLSKENAGY